MKPVTVKTWAARRATLSTGFDIECHRIAQALLALQSRELAALQREPPGRISQRDLNQMAQAIRKVQEVGRMALGETTDRKQLELNLDMPEIALRWAD